MITLSIIGLEKGKLIYEARCDYCQLIKLLQLLRRAAPELSVQTSAGDVFGPTNILY